MSSNRTEVNGLTIDGSESRDLDDAFWLESTNEKTLLHLSITDVSDEIIRDSELDKKAQKKCFTRYFSDSNHPMLPHEYSEDSLSLLEGQQRKTITLSIPIDHHGNAESPIIRKTYLQNKAKLNYKQAEEIMGEPTHNLYKVLNKAHQLAQLLFKKRLNNGAITLYDLNKGITTSEDGIIQQISADESYNSHIIIQEFMILVNQVIAHFFAENDIPGLYRNHTSKAVAPERESLLKDVNNIMKIGDNERINTLVQKFMLIFNKASYDPIIEGHYALNLPAYMHITSPIRRYVDLVNMRQLSAFISNNEDNKPDKLPYSTQELSQISQHVNAVTLAYQQEKSRFFKGKTHEKNINILSDNRDLSTLEGNELYLLLKTATYKNSLPENLHSKITRHLESNTLSVRELFVLLFNAGKSTEWMALKTLALAGLSKNIHNATSLLTMVAQKHKWSAVKYQQDAIGEPPQTFFTVAEITVKGKEYTSDSQEALTLKNKKLSEQLANFNLLCKILKIDNDFSIFKNTKNQEYATGNNNNPIIISNQNYVGKLVELCTEKGWTAVQYDFEREGPSHQPIFEVQAKIRINDILYCSEKIQGGNKKLGKQLASADLIKQLLALPTSASTVTQKSINFIGMLNNLMLKQKQEPPHYNFDFSKENGPFTCICTITQPDHTAKQTQAHGASKKNTKKVAAKKMWGLLSKEVDPKLIERVERIESH